MKSRGKSLQLVIKTVERCNINCSYCYVFNMIDQSYKRHPPYINSETLNAIATFIQQGCHDLELEEVSIVFIGGEPLMQKKRDFDNMCAMFQSNLGSIVKVNFSLQTNAILVDEEWIELFQKYNIGIGVSLDGPKEYHDKDRVDRRSRGTYDRVVEKIKLLQRHLHDKIGILCVINPQHSPKLIYRHFVDELGIKNFDFLLPDFHHDNLPQNFSADSYGDFLCGLFDEWLADNNPEIDVRFLSSTINVFTGGNSYLYGQGPLSQNTLPLISIASNGELSPTDELRNTDPKLILNSDYTVFNSKLIDFLQLPIFKQIEDAQQQLPDKCQSCCWRNICNGGALGNRFNNEHHFNNESIYCSGLKDYYSHVTANFLKNGYCYDRLLERMGLEEYS